MELHADNPSIVRFQRFDDAVRRACRHAQTPAQIRDSLNMVGIGNQPFRMQDISQARAWRDANLVLGRATVGAVDVGLCLRLGIAVDGAARHGVDKLHAITDAQHGSHGHSAIDQFVAEIALCFGCGQIRRKLRRSNHA